MTGPGGAHLGLDDSQPFVVCRRLGKAEEPVPPVHRDFALMFMAAEPEGTSELDYEVEESGILTATERLPVRLQVEESGALAFLGERLAADGPFEALHLSCHGQIGEQGPYLALETETGALHPATAGDLVGAVGQNKPVLTFLSACRTAETDGTGERAVTPLARQITMSGIPNVIGWDGSVYDTDAIVFARTLYEQLAKKAEIPLAVAMARGAVHRAATEADRPENCHWHLARLYLGPTGGGRLCEAGKPGRQFRKDVGHKEFLDPKRETVPVATAREFVGRRREAQRIIRALRGNAQDGVLITGMGNLGKSSLAARVANRLSNLTPVVIFGKERSAYAARNILAAVLDAVPAVERAGCRERWEQAVANDPVALREALEDLLGGALAEKPILLIIDDLEKILVEPEAQDGAVRVPLRDAAGVPELYRVTLGAVLRAFHGDNSDSRLLLTSRYDFTVPEGGQELSEPLYREPLIPMQERQRIKQWKAKREVQGEGGVEVDPALVMDLLGVSGGESGVAGCAVGAGAQWRGGGCAQGDCGYPALSADG